MGVFYEKYKASILFNKNLIISAVAGFFSSAYVSQVYQEFDQSEFANSALALVTEYAVYLPLFATLFYVDNRGKYVDPVTGRRNRQQLLADIKKLIASFGVSEIIFAAMRFGSQYVLLGYSIAAYEASMVGSLLAWAVFFISVNAMARMTRLHHHIHKD